MAFFVYMIFYGKKGFLYIFLWEFSVSWFVYLHTTMYINIYCISLMKDPKIGYTGGRKWRNILWKIKVLIAIYNNTPMINPITTTIPPEEATFLGWLNLFMSSHKSPTLLQFLIHFGRNIKVTIMLMSTEINNKLSIQY